MRSTAEAPATLAPAQRALHIALLNPNTSEASTAIMLASARRALPPGATVSGHTATRGHALIADTAALQETSALMVPFALAVARAGADALVISAFGDPGLAAIRQRVAIPVAGLAEAGIAEAAQGGRRFSIVTVTPALQDSLAQAARQHGQAGQLASIRFTQGAVGDAMQGPQALEDALLDACRLAVQADGAQAIVIGGGPLAQAAAGISARLDVPVIDPVAAAVRLACRRCDRGPRIQR